MSLEFYYIKRIVTLNLFIQACLFITFSMIQAPGILLTLTGLNIGKLNFLILIGLSVLEWSNFLILLSLIFSIIWIVYTDFIVKDVKILFLQLGRSSKDLFRCLFLPCFYFAIFFIINSVFLRPKINFILRRHLLETIKTGMFSMIEPNKILKPASFHLLKDISFSLADRQHNNLYGVLIHQEQLSLVVMIHKFHFIQNDMMDIHMNKILLHLEKLNMNMKCDQFSLSINPDAVNVDKQISVFEEVSFDTLFGFFKIFIITIFLSLWVYTVIFIRSWLIKMMVTIGYLLDLFNAVNLIYFDKLIFLAILLIILANFIRIRRCSNF